MYPKEISPKLLVWLPRNGLLNILLFVIFSLLVIIQSIITWAFFNVLKNRFHHFIAHRMSFHLVYLMALFDDVDIYPRLLIFDLWSIKKCWLEFFVTFCGYLLGIHLLVVKVSVWGLKRITRYVLFCSNVYGIIAEIPCSIAHLKAHSNNLGLQIH